jgi:hypothetical protein
MGERAKQGDVQPIGVLEQAASPSRRAKVQAAFIGPTVWELEGPIPILNRSKTLTAMAQLVNGISGHPEYY